MAFAPTRLTLPVKSTVLRLFGAIKDQHDPSAWRELSGAWEKLTDYLSRVGLQHSPVFFAPNKPSAYQAHLLMGSQYLLQTDSPSFGVAPRSRDGKGRRRTAAQSAEHALSHKLLTLLDPDHHGSSQDDAVATASTAAAIGAPSDSGGGGGPRSLPLPAVPSPVYSSYKDELYGLCKRLGVPMPLFYAYAVTDRPKSCMAIASCGALTRCHGQVVMRGLRSSSLEETLIDLAEVALYALQRVRLEELVATSSHVDGCRIGTGTGATEKVNKSSKRAARGQSSCRFIPGDSQLVA